MMKYFLGLLLIVFAHYANASAPIVLTDLNDVEVGGVDCLISSTFLNSEMSTRDFMLGKSFTTDGRFLFMVDYSCRDNSIGVGINGKGYVLYSKYAENFERGTIYYSKDKKVSVFIKKIGVTPGDENPYHKGCMDSYNLYQIEIYYYGSKKIFRSTGLNESCEFDGGIKHGIDDIVNSELNKIKKDALKKKNFNPVISIGVVAPFTGDAMSSGTDFFNGAQLAVDEINGKKLTINGKNISIRLIKADESVDSPKAAQFLVTQTVNAAIGHLALPSAIEEAKTYWSAEIPLVTPSATDFNALGSLAEKEAFPLSIGQSKFLTDSYLFDFSLRKLRKENGDDIFVIYDGIDNLKEHRSSSNERSAKNYKFYEISKDTNLLVNYENGDFSLKGERASVILNVSKESIQYAIDNLKNIKSINNVIILQGECPESIGVENSDIHISCLEPVPLGTLNPEGMNAFKEQYRKKIGSDPLNYAPYGYDAVQIIVAAMLNANSVLPEDYRLFLAKRTNYHGLTGDISFVGGSQALNALQLELYKYKNGTVKKSIVSTQP